MDNQVAIVGGRNMGEEYFQLKNNEEFLDFDVLSAGPVVKNISTSFDTYWNHELAVPVEALRHKIDEDDLAGIRARVRPAMKESGDSVYA